MSDVPKLRKNLIPSTHDDDAIDEETGGKKKLEIMLYDITKEGLILSTQLCATYNLARNTKTNEALLLFFSPYSTLSSYTVLIIIC